MAGFIRLSEERCWSAPNWVYWGLFDHLMGRFEHDPLLQKKLEQFKWMQNLSVPLLRQEDHAAAEEIQMQLRAVAREATQGDFLCSTDGRELDSASQLEFQQALNALIELMDESL